MSAIHPRRRHTEEFKQKVCADIRSGTIGRREASRLYRLSDNLIHSWLARFEGGARVYSVSGPQTSLTMQKQFEDKIAFLERKVGQLVMAIDERSLNRARRR